MVSLRDVRISVRKGKAYPTFCDQSAQADLFRAKQWLESNLGRRVAEFDEDSLRQCFSDPKLAEAGISVLYKFYSFRSRTLSELLGDQEAERLARTGITSPVELRFRLFEFLSSRHSGFMSSESREMVLREFAAEIDIGLGQLEEALWLDEDDSKVLSKIADAPNESLGAVLNTEIISAMLCSSYLMRLGPVKEGSSLKFIFRNLKFYGLLYSVVHTDDGFTFQVDGPLDIIGRPHRLGYRMAILLYRLRQLSLRREFDCGVCIEFRKGKRKVVFEGTISQLPDLAWPNVGELKLDLFDSKVEAKVYSTFRAMDLGGWRIEREPMPFIAGNTVFIPDFSIEREGNRVFVEVVGFWIPEYRKRKKAKLEEVKNAGLDNLILLVDERAEQEFRAITDFPIFAYARSGSSYRIPYSVILEHLEARFPRRQPRPPDRATPPRARYVRHGDAKYRIFW